MNLVVDTSNLNEILKFANKISDIMAVEEKFELSVIDNVWREFDFNVPVSPELS